MKTITRNKYGLFLTALGISLTSSLFVGCSTENEELTIDNELHSNSSSLAIPTIGKVYTISNLKSGRTLDIQGASNSDEANLQLWGTDINTSATNRQWEIINGSDGYIRLKGVDSGKVLQTESNTSNGENVYQYEYNELAWQEWELTDVGDGYYSIINRNSDKALRATGTNNGSNVEVWKWKNWKSQKWFFTEIGDLNTPPTSFIDTNDGTFNLNDFQIESSSHLSSSTSTTTTSWSFNDQDILGSEWYYLSNNDYYLKSAPYKGKRTELKEYPGIESSLNTDKVLTYEASVEDISENGITIAQVHNRFKESDDYKSRRPLLRVYIEDGKIRIKKTSNDLTNSSGSYDPVTIGPSISEGSKFKVQLTTGNEKVNVKVETNNDTLDEDFTPYTGGNYNDYKNYFYFKAGVYTEGYDSEPKITFYSFEKE